MAHKTLIVEPVQDGVLLIRLNRPEALNALNSELLVELAGVVREAEADDGVRCLVITGSERAFAAGPGTWPGPTACRPCCARGG